METKDLGKSSTGIQPNVAALLSYLAGFITGIIFFVIEKENKFVRFHAMQSIVTFGVLFVAGIFMAFIPVIGPIVGMLIWILELVLWVILMVKAYNGEKFKLPIAGDFAEKNS